MGHTTSSQYGSPGGTPGSLFAQLRNRSIKSQRGSKLLIVYLINRYNVLIGELELLAAISSYYGKNEQNKDVTHLVSPSVFSYAVTRVSVRSFKRFDLTNLAADKLAS